MEVVEGSGGDITSFLKTQQGDIDTHLLDGMGAVLLRGFHVPDAVELDEIARSLNFTPLDTYIPGIAPRKAHKARGGRWTSLDASFARCFAIF